MTVVAVVSVPASPVVPVCQPAPLSVVDAAAAAPLMPDPLRTSTVIVFQAGFDFVFLPVPLDVLSGPPPVVGVVDVLLGCETGVTVAVLSLGPATENAQIRPSSAIARPPTARIRVLTPRGI